MRALTLKFRNEKNNVDFVTSYKCNGSRNKNISGSKRDRPMRLMSIYTY